MNCSHCGKELAEGGTVCSSCSHPIVGPHYEVYPRPWLLKRLKKPSPILSRVRAKQMIAFMSFYGVLRIAFDFALKGSRLAQVGLVALFCSGIVLFLIDFRRRALKKMTPPKDLP